MAEAEWLKSQWETPPRSNCGDLKAERNRLREALRELVDAKDAVEESDASEIGKVRNGILQREEAAWFKARTALREASDE